MLNKGEVPTPLKNARWRELYLAALFEDDQTRISARIAEAEVEMVTRARTLFNAPGDNSDEWDALDDALYMLRALKNCLRSETTGKRAA